MPWHADRGAACAGGPLPTPCAMNTAMSLAPPGFDTSPLAGMDFSWLAVDADGHVAWLVTFGSAVVPKWVEAQRGDFADAEAALARLPETGDCSARETSPSIEQWLDVARRGVFAFDWDVYRGPYRLLAAPTHPLNIEALPPELAGLARRTRFTGLCFRERLALGLQDVLACEHGAAPPAD